MTPPSPVAPKGLRLLARQLFLVSCLCLTAPPAVAEGGAIALPDMGDSAGAILSPQQEREVGAGLLRDLRRDGRIIDDPDITRYVESVGQSLVSYSEGASQTFTFFVVDDAAINAFAAPGGFIGIHTGLILASRNESELAAVIAHEIAHVTQRHMARTFEAANQLGLSGAIAIMGAILLGSQYGQIGEAAANLAIAGQAQYGLNFTRSHEYEADRIGIHTLAAAGYEPKAMATFFDLLTRQGQLYGSRLPEILRTHPVSSNRIAEALGRAERYQGIEHKDHLEYHLTKARLRVLSHQDPGDAEREFAGNLRIGRFQSKIAERFGYALALQRVGKFKEAGGILDELLAKDPERITFIGAAAENDLAAGNTDRALNRLDRALQIYPGNSTLTELKGKTLLDNGRAEAAYTLLEHHTRNNRDSPRAYRLLAQAARAAGHEGESHFAMAEFHYLSGDLQSAIDHLDKALNLIRDDHHLAERVQARKERIQQLIDSMRRGKRRHNHEKKMALIPY